jgi:hypothetical protein
MSILKMIAKKDLLISTENRTRKQNVSLATAWSKLENRTLSNLYKAINNNPYSVDVYGFKTLPTFNDFCAAIKPNETRLYSEYVAFLTLGRMGAEKVKANMTNAEKTAVKVARQNKATAKK